MKKQFIYRLLVVGALAMTLAFGSSLNESVAAQDKLEAGLYFTDTVGSKGEFYSFISWSKLTPVKQTNLIIKYKPQNISVYVSATNKVSTIKDITSAKSFDKASKVFVEGDIAGLYTDATTGKDIVASVTENFEVTDIY